MAEPMLSIENVNVVYGGTHADREVSLRIDKGEVVTLIGANGAGKSTTLRAVSGLIAPRSGRVTFEGQDVTGTAAHHLVARGISMSPEGRGVFANLTVLENLEMGAYLVRDAARVRQDIERGFALFPRLKERAKQRAGTLSGGEQQMLAMARALMSRPQLLLLDEPSMGLAPVLVELVFKTIQDINAQGMTVLLVEQNAHMALSIAHRGYVLQTGKIVLSDTAKNLAANEMVRKAYLGEE